MLHVEEIKPRVLDADLSGKLTRDDILALEKALDPLLKGDGPIAFVLRLDGVTDMTGDAIAEDLRYETALLPHLARFRKVAIVTDKEFYGALVRFFDPLLPMIDMRIFTPDRLDEARAFAVEPIGGPAEFGEGIRMIESRLPGVIAFEIDGAMAGDATMSVIEEFDRRTADRDRFDLFARVRNFAGFDPRILGDSRLWSVKLSAMQRVRRYAIVGAPGWMASMAGGIDAMLPMDLRCFAADEEEAAWAWLGEAD